MDPSSSKPAPPAVPALAWRPIGRNDLDALVELSRACQRVDGGLAFMAEPEYVKDLYFPGEPGSGIGAFDLGGSLTAGATVHLNHDGDTLLAAIAGEVRPDLRGVGIGSYLMRWSTAEAQTLMTGAAAGQTRLQIHTERLTESAAHLYAAHGFEKVYESFAMQCDLTSPLPEQPPPAGVTLVNWQPALANEFFRAYEAAFRDRPGFPGWSAEEWIAKVIENDHKPEWSFLARVGDQPAGFIIGNADLTSRPPNGFIWQVGVAPDQRRRGLASILMLASMRRMQVEGARSAALTVNADNPGAVQAYLALGFTILGRRARFIRQVTP